jgi:hypothetical protein
MVPRQQMLRTAALYNELSSSFTASAAVRLPVQCLQFRMHDDLHELLCFLQWLLWQVAAVLMIMLSENGTFQRCIHRGCFAC